MQSNSASIAWLSLLSTISRDGEDIAPRGIPTKEILAHTSVIDMNSPIVNIPERKLNYRFMFAEAWWILSGSNRVADIAQYMKNIAQFSDNGITFRGAYGPKIVEQLDYIVETLAKDQNTRQAVLNIWRENPRPTKDYPCTLNMQWLIRDGKLNCMTNMRSSDAWLGWVYDVFNFSMISNWVLIALRENRGIELELGNLYLTAGSQHLYSHNYEAAGDLLSIYSEGCVQEVDESINTKSCVHPDVILETLELLAESYWHDRELNIKQVQGIFNNGKID